MWYQCCVTVEPASPWPLTPFPLMLSSQQGMEYTAAMPEAAAAAVLGMSAALPDVAALHCLALALAMLACSHCCSRQRWCTAWVCAYFLACLLAHAMPAAATAAGGRYRCRWHLGR